MDEIEEARKVLTSPPGSYRWDVIRRAQGVLLVELDRLQGIENRALDEMALPHDDEALFVLQHVLHGED